tara:strand:- start:140 stop:406 length:267 start_codon:yes stop_codon:yes gene_type:complete
LSKTEKYGVERKESQGSRNSQLVAESNLSHLYQMNGMSRDERFLYSAYWGYRERDLSFRRILGNQIIAINDANTVSGSQCWDMSANDR